MSLRVGIDIDCVLTDIVGAEDLAASAPSFWETLPEIERGVVTRLAAVADVERWEVIFLTRRPDIGGSTAQVQTQRWLERHGFPLSSVYVVTGSRGKIASALALDIVIDDALENCLDVAIDSSAKALLIWSGDDALVSRSLRGLNVTIVGSLSECLDRLTNQKPTGDRPRLKRLSSRPASAGTVPVPVPPSRASRTPLTSATYFAATIFFAAFAIYGSLVPFHFRPKPMEEAFAQFAKVPYLTLGIGSRADFVSNILLFIPLGFLFSGACLVDRGGRVRFILASAFVLVSAFVLSVAIEFMQIFFPPRTVSLNDIVAETAGAAIGVALWGLVGPGITEWTRSFLRERDRPTFVQRILQAYVVGYVVWQLIPFDVTIDLGDLAQKYREGRIILVPFGFLQPSLLGIVWEFATDILLWVPVGVLACIGWILPGTRRHHFQAVALGVLVVLLVEAMKVFVFTRYADVTHLLTGALGIALGIRVASLPFRSMPVKAREGSNTVRSWPVIALFAWIAVLAFYHWAPFDFVLDRQMLRARVIGLWVVPFTNYYYGSEYHAFTEICRKFTLAIPVGALLRLAMPHHPNRAIVRLQNTIVLAIGLALFGGLEAGQLFLPSRLADLTDVLIAVMGVETGCHLVKRLRESGLADSHHIIKTAAGKYPTSFNGDTAGG